MGKNMQKVQKTQGPKKAQGAKEVEKAQNYQSLMDIYGIKVEYAESEERLFELLHYLNNTLFGGQGVIGVYDGAGGNDPRNAGRSGYILAHFGHFIIHLFSQRRVAMVDYFDGSKNENVRKARCSVIMNAVKKQFDFSHCDQCQGRAGQSFGHNIVFQTKYMNQSRMVAIADKILPRIGTKTPSSENTCIVKGSNYDLIYTVPHSHITIHVNSTLDVTIVNVFSPKPVQWDLWQNELATYGLIPQKTVMVDRGLKVEE